MSVDPHEHVVEWLGAAAAGTLSEGRHRRLARHLAACAGCREAVEDPAAVAQVQVALAGVGMFDSGFEERVAGRFRDAVAPPGPERRDAKAKVLRRGFRVALAVTVCLFLVARGLHVRLSYGASALRRGASALCQVVLHTPEYEDLLGAGNVLTSRDEFVATFHKLTTLYVETLLWTILLAVTGLVLFDLYRRHCRLRRLA